MLVEQVSNMHHPKLRPTEPLWMSKNGKASRLTSVYGVSRIGTGRSQPSITQDDGSQKLSTGVLAITLLVSKGSRPTHTV